MNDQSFMEEACEVLASIVVALGAKTCVAGIDLLLDGFKTDNPVWKRQGFEMILSSQEYLTAAAVCGIDVAELLRTEYEAAHSGSAS